MIPNKFALPTCVFLGNKTSETRPCSTCGGGGKPVEVFQCERHGVCTVEKVVEKTHCCRSCQDYTLAKHPPRDLIEGVQDPLPDPRLTSYPDNWPCDTAVKRVHIQALGIFAKQKFPPVEKAEGDGIVYIGGGTWWPMLCVSIRMCRKYTNLPIQVWYNGEKEPVYPEDLKDLHSITYYDQNSVIPKQRIYGGWEGKTIALLYCGLRRAIFLDADAYPVSNPDLLLDLLSPSSPFVYWEDLAAWDESTGWSWFGVHDHIGNRIPCIQGGQFALDLVLFRRELIIAHWLNQHSDYSYHYPGIKEQNHNYGDQNQFRVALAYTNGKYLCLGRAPYTFPAFICHLNGQPLFVHRCQGKMWGNSSDKRTTHLPADREVWKLLDHFLIGDGSFKDILTRLDGRKLLAEFSDNAEYIRNVNLFIRLAGIESVVDLGCYDGYITMRLQADDVIGVDYYDTHLNTLTKKFFKKKWLLLDDKKDLPQANLLLIRNVLVYWPDKDIIELLNYLKVSKKYKYVLITNNTDQSNDTRGSKLGEFSPVNAQKEPLKKFNLYSIFKDTYLMEIT